MSQYVRDLMTTELVKIRQDVSAHVAVALMLEHNVSSLPVVDEEDQLIGLISEFDVLELYDRAGIADSQMTSCASLMTPDVQSIQAAAESHVAVKIFRSARIRRLLVLDDARLVGVLSRRDILRGMRTQANVAI